MSNMIYMLPISLIHNLKNCSFLSLMSILALEIGNLFLFVNEEHQIN